MTDQDLIAQKVKTYLESLSPKARRLLLGGIEANKKKGDGDKQLDIILAVAQTMVRKNGGQEHRHDHIMRSFFAPVSPFLFDGTATNKQKGRVARSVLGRIWTWIVRDVAPLPLTSLLEKEQSNADIDDETIEQATAQVRAETLRVIREHLAEIQQLPRGTQRLAVQLGGANQVQDLEDILDIFLLEREFDELFAKLSKTITKYDFSAGSFTLKLIDAFILNFPEKSDFVASGLLSRLEDLGLLALAAVRLAKSENAKIIAGTPYRAFIDVLLSEIERRVDAFAENQELGLEIAALESQIESYHSLVRVLEVDLNLDGVSEWPDRLSAIRRRMSLLVTTEIEPVAGCVRRTLRYKVSEGEKLVFDPYSLADARRALTALAVARRASDSLAVNEIQVRTWRTVQATVERMSYDLLDRFRECTTSERKVLGKKLDAAIEFARIVYGDDYAIALKRNRDNVEAAPEKRASTT